MSVSATLCFAGWTNNFTSQISGVGDLLKRKTTYLQLWHGGGLIKEDSFKETEAKY